jgi:hypothetical protein
MGQGNEVMQKMHHNRSSSFISESSLTSKIQQNLPVSQIVPILIMGRKNNSYILEAKAPTIHPEARPENEPLPVVISGRRL